MTRICIISNTGEDLRRAMAWFQEDGLEVDLIYGAELGPIQVSNYDGFIFPGGAGRAYETNVYPWLTQVYQIAQDAIDASVPVLGICLGAQMLTYVLRGQVKHLVRPRTTGMIEIQATEEATDDRLMSALPEAYPMTENHEDYITKLPEGAQLLAFSQNCPVEAFRYGSQCWGVQFHPETGVDHITPRWATDASFTDALEEAGLDIDQIIADAEAQDACNTEYARALFARFAQICHQHNHERA